MTLKLNWKHVAYEARKHYLAGVKILSGCADCGVWGPAEVLSFDHVRGEKQFDIGSRWDVSRAAADEEISKCEIVCHNCHAIRTAKRQTEREAGLPPFEPFPKIPRLSRDTIVTEKIDGTNATIWIDGDNNVWPASKSRWLSVDDDNCGFAAWVEKNREELLDLGPGAHRGEWWGRGIRRGYGLNEKRFSLFNALRWGDSPYDGQVNPTRPVCCHVVPVLYRGPFTTDRVEDALSVLRLHGSHAAPGFMRPEGVVVYHLASKALFKKTLEGDESPKGHDEA